MGAILDNTDSLGRNHRFQVVFSNGSRSTVCFLHGNTASRRAGFLEFGCPGKRGFSLVEVLVAMAVFALLLVLLASAGKSTLQIWSRARGQISSFQSARDTFESLTRKLSQATLNTYWGYNNATNPTQYLRRSELQFVCGQAAALLGADYGPTDAAFFQSPSGYSLNATNRPLNQLLNSCGYFIQFGSDQTNRPGFVNSPARWRYRLMELVQPTEELSVHEQRGTKDWYQTAVAAGEAWPVADNIIALVIRPLRSLAADPSQNREITTDYAYDSSAGNSSTTTTANQLPPLLGMTLVAIDEASAERITKGSTPPAWVTPDLFTETAKFDTDLKTVENNLIRDHVNYRIFSTEIALPGSKWSE